MNKNSLPYAMVFGFITAFLFVVPLSIAHNVTKPIVEYNRELARKRGVLASFDLIRPDRSVADQEVLELYQRVEEKVVDGKTVYIYRHGEETYVASQFTVPGLWGPITAVVSFTGDLSRLKSFAVISHSETPGLGARITEPWFVDQARGEALVNGEILVTVLPKDRNNKDDGQIDAITGATRTSDAMAQLFRLAHSEMQSILRRLP